MLLRRILRSRLLPSQRPMLLLLMRALLSSSQQLRRSLKPHRKQLRMQILHRPLRKATPLRPLIPKRLLLQQRLQRLLTPRLRTILQSTSRFSRSCMNRWMWCACRQTLFGHRMRRTMARLLILPQSLSLKLLRRSRMLSQLRCHSSKRPTRNRLPSQLKTLRCLASSIAWSQWCIITRRRLRTAQQQLRQRPLGKQKK